MSFQCDGGGCLGCSDCEGTAAGSAFISGFKAACRLEESWQSGKAPPTSADKPQHSERRYTASSSKRDPRNPSPPKPTEEPQADPWALPAGWRWCTEGREWAAERAHDNMRIYGSCGDCQTCDSQPSIRDIVALRNRTDPPKTEGPR